MSIPRKIRCHVESITNHGGRVYTVDLAPASAVPSFKPGQFLHLTVDEFDPGGFWPESRVFSIASPPHDRSRIRICYSVKGRYTTKMEQTLKTAGEVWIKLPYGEFVIDFARDAVLVAGGTGISAFTAFLKTLSPESSQEVCLVYGARCPELLLFHDEIMRQIGVVPKLRGLFFTEAGSPAFAGRDSPRVVCLAGRISIEAVWSQVPEPGGKVFYLSGPPVMLQTLSEALRQRDVPASQIRTDAWE
jgi:ferredoxin-NADP reductase